MDKEKISIDECNLPFVVIENGINAFQFDFEEREKIYNFFREHKSEEDLNRSFFWKFLKINGRDDKLILISAALSSLTSILSNIKSIHLIKKTEGKEFLLEKKFDILVKDEGAFILLTFSETHEFNRESKFFKEFIDIFTSVDYEGDNSEYKEDIERLIDERKNDLLKLLGIKKSDLSSEGKKELLFKNLRNNIWRIKRDYSTKIRNISVEHDEHLLTFSESLASIIKEVFNIKDYKFLVENEGGEYFFAFKHLKNYHNMEEDKILWPYLEICYEIVDEINEEKHIDDYKLYLKKLFSLRDDKNVNSELIERVIPEICARILNFKTSDIDGEYLVNYCLRESFPSIREFKKMSYHLIHNRLGEEEKELREKIKNALIKISTQV